MSKKYMFAVEEIDEGGKMISIKNHIFNTESESWGGFDGPMHNFLDFLRGEGFVFSADAEIGVMTSVNGGKPEFRSAVNW